MVAGLELWALDYELRLPGSELSGRAELCWDIRVELESELKLKLESESKTDLGLAQNKPISLTLLLSTT